VVDSVFKYDCKQLKEICSCFINWSIVWVTTRSLSHVNCLCDPLHDNTATVLLSYNVKLTDLTPADCWLWRDSNWSCWLCNVKLFQHLACWFRRLIPSVVSGMIWCTVCSYHSSFSERCIRLCVLGKHTVCWCVSAILICVPAVEYSELWVGNGWLLQGIVVQ